MRFDASLDVCDKRISLAHPPTHCAYEVVQNVTIVTVAINSIVEVRDWKIHKSRVNISALNESSTQYDQPCLSRVLFVKFLSFLKKHVPTCFWLHLFVILFVFVRLPEVEHKFIIYLFERRTEFIFLRMATMPKLWNARP